MSLHNTRASALLAWVNSLKLDENLNSLAQLQDCRLFIKIINKIHGSEEEQPVLQQSTSERVAYLVSFLEKHCKHKSTPHRLVSEEKLLAADELELAKVAMLLLYCASMSDKIPREWTAVEYDLQAEMAEFLNFMLYNEECLGENLETFLQKKMPQSSNISNICSEENTPPKQQVAFLKLQKIASSSSLNKPLPGSSASPMGDIMQTPQFQIRRLKKLLEAERDNRDELEHELAENRKLIDEKDTRILVMKQRIDRLTLLHERQAADQLEPKEMEELREKNESLLIRLHETLKQCQDLKTEKGQMDRKINQLSEENGDLTFRLREFTRIRTELQEAMNDISEEYNTALREWEEKRAHQETELHTALDEKRGLEEKVEILQGKVSLLEDQMAKLKESSSLAEKGEVMGDVLKFEDLNQQVAQLSGKQAELQATIQRLEEERGLLEATLQSERGSAQAEKLQVTSLLTELQNSLSELSRAKEKLEQDLQAQESCLMAQVNGLTANITKLTGCLQQKDGELLALHQQVEAEKVQKGQLAEDLQAKEQISQAALQELTLQVDQLKNALKLSGEKLAQVEVAGQEEYNRIAQEKELALRQLQQKEAELSALAECLQAQEHMQKASAAEAQREKAELSQRVQELEARVLSLTVQCQQNEAQAGAMPALKSQLREAQQKLVEREKLAKENTRLQERLLILEESVRNTEGILEDEKRRAGEALESNLRRIAELEEQSQELTRHRDQAVEGAREEKAKRQALEAQVQLLQEESRKQVEELQHLKEGSSPSRGGEHGKKLEEKVQRLSLDCERAQQKLKAEQEKVAQLEAKIKHLDTKHQEVLTELEAEKSHALAQVREKEEEVEKKWKAELTALQEELVAARQEATQSLAKAKEEGREAERLLEAASQNLAEERLRRAELEARVKQLGERSQKELATAESHLSTLRSTLKDKEKEIEALSGQAKSLKTKLEEATQQQKEMLALRDEEAKQLATEKKQSQTELVAEKSRRAALEVQLQDITSQQHVEVSSLREEAARAQERLVEKEQEFEELRLKNASRGQELSNLQETVGKLKGELASAKALKEEREAKMESRLQGCLEVTRMQEAEVSRLQSLVQAKELSLQQLEEEKRHWERERDSSREGREVQLKECEALRGQVGKLEQQCREQQSTLARLEKVVAASEKEQLAEVQALKQDVTQQRQRACELEKALEVSRSTQESTAEKLKQELREKGEELAQSREAASRAEKELASLRLAAAQEKGKSEESWKEQISHCLQEAERKASLISSLEQEMSIMHRQLLEKEAESKDLRRLVLAESEKSKKLEERLRILQSEMATAASRAAERCSTMKAEAQNAQEQVEKMRLSGETLKKELALFSQREAEFCKELQAWQEKVFQKDQLLTARQQELAGAQALVGELMPIKGLYQQLQVEQAAQEVKRREEVEQAQRSLGVLQAELARAKLECAELLSLKERCLQQEGVAQRLQAENGSYAERLATLQQAHAQLVEENRALSERSSQGLQQLEEELVQAKWAHTQQLEAAKGDAEKRVAVSQQEAEEAQKKLQATTSKYEEAKQKLQVQVEQLEVYQKEQAKQVDELKQKLAQQEKAVHAQQQKAQGHEEELQTMAKQLNEKVTDLQSQLAQKEKTTEHYKAQMEKAKTHYNAKKQETQELLKKLKAMEKENVDLKAESDRLGKELQQAVMQAKESELSCKNLSSRVRVLEAQVEFADRQLREQGKFQVARDTLKSREMYRQSPVELSTDSLDLSTSDEAQPLNSTRKTRRSLSESGTTELSKASHSLPHKMESLESLYFTPIPTRTRSKLENSLGSTGDFSFESGQKTISGRRRTTQKHAEPDVPGSGNESFFSVESTGLSQASAPIQETVKTRLRSAASGSTRSLASLPSQESLHRLDASSPQDTASNATLMSLPGYRPATRSSMRRSQASTVSSRRSSFYLSTCQDEPEQQDDWNRIAELQQRNRVCPPHLKTCYPLESRPSQMLTTITDEEMMTGDPQETLRRASMLPSQIAEGPTTRRSTLSSASAAGVATRQQRKRLSDESQLGPGTPESKKSASCFPRPQTPKGRAEERKHSTLVGSKKTKAPAADKQSERRQSLAFSILNTPKKLGSSLLRRGANRKTTPKNSPRTGTRRSPRTPVSPKSKSNSKFLRNTKV